MKEKVNEEQKNILAKNLRKQYATLIGLIESASLLRYNETIGAILSIICIVLFFKMFLPAKKENDTILKELE